MGMVSSLFGGSSSQDNSIAQQRAQQEADERARQQRVTRGANTIRRTFDNTFDNNFYNNIGQSYLNFAQPELDRQREEQQRALTYALADSGNLNSSTAVRRQQQLDDAYQRNRQNLDMKSKNYEQQKYSDVQNARSDLLRTNAAAADPNAAAAQAQARASALAATPEFDPLGQMFEDAAAGIANRMEADRIAEFYKLAGGETSMSPNRQSGSAAYVKS